MDYATTWALKAKVTVKDAHEKQKNRGKQHMEHPTTTDFTKIMEWLK